jgi:hypothetical protein
LRLSVPVRLSITLSRVGQHGRAKEGEMAGLYLIRDPPGARWWKQADRQGSAALLKLSGP